MLKLHNKQACQQNKSKKKIAVFTVIAALAVGGAYIFKLYQDGSFADNPLPPAPTSGTTPMPVQTAAVPAVESTPQAPLPEAEDPMQLHMRGTSEALTILLAEQDVLKAQAENARLEREIAGLVTPAVPTVVSTPPSANPGETTALPSQSSSLPLIRSIIGLDGKVSAVLVSGGASRPVKRGDSFAGGKVERINTQGVDFRTSDGTVHALNFEE